MALRLKSEELQGFICIEVSVEGAIEMVRAGIGLGI